jgi:NADPH:quinone reductase-like Zn-dependent oxidoreductase
MEAAIRSGCTTSHYAFATDYAIPTLTKQDHVLIKVNAAALNPVDYKLPKMIGGNIFGIDFCGTVTQVGSSVTTFQVGDLVFGPASTGSLCEFTIADAAKIAKVPGGWTHLEAASLPVAYVTAVTGFAKGKITPESCKESMLVVGASGGCGIAACQLAKGMGVTRIIGICSSKNADFVKKNGATEIVDYNDAEGLKKFYDDNAGKIDFVYDAATGSGGDEDYAQVTLPLLKKDGAYVALNGKPANLMGQLILGCGFWDKRQMIHLCTHSTKDLETVTTMLDKNKFRPALNIFEFNEAGVQSGFDQLKSRRTKGKLVCEIAPVEEK